MILALLRPDDFWYQLVYLLHILAIIVGFGPLFVLPVYAVFARNRPGAPGLAMNEASYAIAKWLDWVIVSVPVWGIILILLSEDAIDFDQVWISVAFGVYIVALVVAFGLHRPNLRRMLELQRELAGQPSGHESGPTPAAVELERRGKRSGMYAGILHLSVVVLLADMVWKPGL